MMPIACRVVMYKEGQPFGAVPFEPSEFSVPFCLGETRHYFKQCDLFCSFHAIVEVQFGGLAQLDRAINNYRDNLNSLYHHPDMTLSGPGTQEPHSERLLTLHRHLGYEQGLHGTPRSPHA